MLCGASHGLHTFLRCSLANPRRRILVSVSRQDKPVGASLVVFRICPACLLFPRVLWDLWAPRCVLVFVSLHWSITCFPVCTRFKRECQVSKVRVTRRFDLVVAVAALAVVRKRFGHVSWSGISLLPCLCVVSLSLSEQRALLIVCLFSRHPIGPVSLSLSPIVSWEPRGVPRGTGTYVLLGFLDKLGGVTRFCYRGAEHTRLTSHHE